MPIKKETSARLVKEKIPYEIISREVVPLGIVAIPIEFCLFFNAFKSVPKFV